MKFQLTINGMSTFLEPQFPFVDNRGVSNPPTVLRLWTTEELEIIGVTKVLVPEDDQE